MVKGCSEGGKCLGSVWGRFFVREDNVLRGGGRLRRSRMLGMLCFLFCIKFSFMFWDWGRSKMLGSSFQKIFLHLDFLQRVKIALVFCHLFVIHFLSLEVDSQQVLLLCDLDIHGRFLLSEPSYC